MSINLEIPDQACTADLLEFLEKHVAECEKLARYEEAQVALTRLMEVRAAEVVRRREEMRSSQLAERLELEEANAKEVPEFHELWDKKDADFESNASQLQQNQVARHKEEHALFMDKIQKETELRTPRWSRELLNLRKIQAAMAKQKRYTESAKTKQEADALEEKELAAWNAKQDGKMATLEEQFLQKQKQEMAAFLKKMERGRQEHKLARKAALERLRNRHHNAKTQLEAQHNIIKQKFEKFPENPSLSMHRSCRDGPLPVAIRA